MTKYSFVLLGGESEEFLSKVQEIGLIDLTRSRKPVDDFSSKLFSEAEALRKKIERIQKDDFSRDDEHNALCARLSQAEIEYNNRLPWGDFSSQKIAALEQFGYKLHFHTTSSKGFNQQWQDIRPVEIISDNGKNCWFVSVTKEGETDAFPIEECSAPEGSYVEMAEEIESLKKSLSDREKILSDEKQDIPSMQAEYSEKMSLLQRYLAKKASVTAADDIIDTYVGFAPTDKDNEVTKALDEAGFYYFNEPATKEDNPPIKLKNNWFAKNFETLTGMYGMPVYDEFDPTPILAPFFLLFWAFCMCDAGYGLLLMGVALMVRKVNILGLKPHWRLVMTLGVGTTVIGLFMASFFGIELTKIEWIPEGLRNCMLSGKLTVGQTTYDYKMLAALAIGIFHLCLAMVINAVCITKRFGIAKALSSWGWIVLIVGGLCIAALAMANVMDSSVTKIAVIIIGIVAGLSIYIFNTPGRNPMINVGAGLWDTYGKATGLLGDVLSYIRLYALGLAGGMLASAFNDLGAMTLGDNPTWQYLAYVAILIFGHALNFAMSCLGAFVHPLRLTFVEYFKNAGYEGKGLKYEPLKK